MKKCDLPKKETITKLEEMELSKDE